MLWVGSDASPQLLKDLFDVDDFLHIDPTIARICVWKCSSRTDLGLDRRNYLFSRRGCLSRSATSSTIGTRSGAGRPSCLSRGKTWMGPSSNSPTCWSRTRTMRRCHISTVRVTYAVENLLR